MRVSRALGSLRFLFRTATLILLSGLTFFFFVKFVLLNFSEKVPEAKCLLTLRRSLTADFRCFGSVSVLVILVLMGNLISNFRKCTGMERSISQHCLLFGYLAAAVTADTDLL